jgi:hypothetical protein
MTVDLAFPPSSLRRPASFAVLKRYRHTPWTYASSWLYQSRISRVTTWDGRGSVAGQLCELPGWKVLIGFHSEALHATAYPANKAAPGSSPDVLASWLRNLARLNGHPVVLRKITGPVARELQQLGKSPVGIINLEDDSFPETYIDVERTLSLTNHRRSNLERGVRRFSAVLSQHNVERRSGLQLAGKLQTTFDTITPNTSLREAYSNMLTQIESAFADGVEGIWCDAYFLDGTAVAIYILDVREQNCAGLYCGVVARGLPGGVEWFDHDVIQRVASHGVTTLYLGGSENSGVMSYVEKLAPRFVAEQPTSVLFA